MKMVLFILSMSDVCCPFLVVTPSSLLSQWEAEFRRWAPSIDVVVYSGSRDSRRRIKSLEFYDEGGFMMLQVLLSSLEAVIEVCLKIDYFRINLDIGTSTDNQGQDS